MTQTPALSSLIAKKKEMNLEEIGYYPNIEPNPNMIADQLLEEFKRII
jgi:hypothetical protein